MGLPTRRFLQFTTVFLSPSLRLARAGFDVIKKEDGVGAGVEVPTATGKRKRKRPFLGSPEKKIKTEKVEAPPPISKKSDETISLEYLKGRLSLMKQYLHEAWRGEMIMRYKLAKTRRTMEGLEKILDEKSS